MNTSLSLALGRTASRALCAHDASHHQNLMFGNKDSVAHRPTATIRSFCSNAVHTID